VRNVDELEERLRRMKQENPIGYNLLAVGITIVFSLAVLALTMFLKLLADLVVDR
jgi:hypothetical protein